MDTIVFDQGRADDMTSETQELAVQLIPKCPISQSPSTNTNPWADCSLTQVCIESDRCSLMESASPEISVVVQDWQRVWFHSTARLANVIAVVVVGEVVRLFPSFGVCDAECKHESPIALITC